VPHARVGWLYGYDDGESFEALACQYVFALDLSLDIAAVRPPSRLDN
jgi:hypothetical protein